MIVLIIFLGNYILTRKYLCILNLLFESYVPVTAPKAKLKLNFSEISFWKGFREWYFLI